MGTNQHSDVRLDDCCDLAEASLIPPDIIVRSGQEVVTLYAKLKTQIFNPSRNDQFAVGCDDFLEWLEDQNTGLTLDHVIEDNVVVHLDELALYGLAGRNV